MASVWRQGQALALPRAAAHWAWEQMSAWGPGDATLARPTLGLLFSPPPHLIAHSLSLCSPPGSSISAKAEGLSASSTLPCPGALVLGDWHTHGLRKRITCTVTMCVLLQEFRVLPKSQLNKSWSNIDQNKFGPLKMYIFLYSSRCVKEGHYI